MITVKRLKYLLKQVPDDATIYAYEGECVGIQLQDKNDKLWWVRMSAQSIEDTYTEGFKEESK